MINLTGIKFFAEGLAAGTAVLTAATGDDIRKKEKR